MLLIMSPDKELNIEDIKVKHQMVICKYFNFGYYLC